MVPGRAESGAGARDYFNRAWFFSMNAVPKVGAAQWEPADRKEPRKAVWTYPFQGMGERKGDWNYGNGL